MADTRIIIPHTSPKELIVITPTADGVAIASGYKVLIALVGAGAPLLGDTNWQTPDVDGAKTGIFVGPVTTAPVRAFTAGQAAMPFMLYDNGTEKVIRPCGPVVYFT
jgi:hypothetical protein